MSGNGAQLAKLTELIDAGIIRRVIDRAFPFTAMNDAMSYLESGRAKGKVVVSLP